MSNRSIKFKGRLRSYLCAPLYLIGVLVLLHIPFYLIDTRAGICISAFTGIYSVTVIVTYYRNRPLLVNELINFATQYGSIQKKLLNDFEIAYALLDYNGKLLWVNKQFEQMTGKDKSYHKSITSLFPSITKELLQGEESLELNLSMEEQHFRVSMSRIYFDAIISETNMLEMDSDNNYLTAVYFFDETRLHHYIQENEDQKMVVAQVYIDNYDEALESIEDVKRSLLVALIDRKVNAYFSKVDALVRKTEKDKYFIVFRHEYLKALKEDKFSVLEDVKTVKVGNTMAVTLSIGIGDTAATYSQNNEYSRMAIDLALGRGGDQVVLREGEKVTYFGGKAQQVERNTRVKARVKAHALRGIIESKERVIVMGHQISDMDSFGAAIGIYCAARTLDKKVQIVLNTVSSTLRPFRECFTEEKGYAPDTFLTREQAIEVCTPNTVVMVVDTNRPGNTECPEILKMTKNIVVFDHHRQSNDVIENPVLSYIEPYASSSCEMVAEVLQYFTESIKLAPQEADSLYAGILIDTNNFMAKTGVRTFEAAAYLKRCGAEVTRVRKMLRNDMCDYKARAEVVRHAEVYRDAFAISVCPTENIESPTIVGAQAANELLNITGIKASFVLTEFKGKVYISSRSIDEINVQLIMEALGGGGHLTIAGAQLEHYTIAEVKRMLQQTIDKMIEEGDIKV
ncbi:MAG: DHH family phosphoesterase [Lachnospiraceae bacterium]|nr:DHH family phosphoesterase [bacterium]MDY5516652.1 DHH family phosphoesterase [Lachnospiraceae bacterium]